MADVICPACNLSFHETTDKYNPDVSPNGSMFKLKDKFASNGWSSFPEDTSTIGDNLYCPECNNSYCEGNPARVRVIGWEAPVDASREDRESAIANFQQSVVASLSQQRAETAPVKGKGGRRRKK